MILVQFLRISIDFTPFRASLSMSTVILLHSIILSVYMFDELSIAAAISVEHVAYHV
jgi:hypothetical protein